MILIYILLSTFFVSLIALIGIIFLLMEKNFLDKLLFILISLAAGALIGGSFLHLFPHSLEYLEIITASWIFIIGFLSFFILERFLRWRHCHEIECEIHPVTYLSLIGDSIHNFIDGVIIASSYLISVKVGIVTTLIVLAHEIPQEISDYAILIFGGMKRIKALVLNTVTALTAILGGIFGYYFLKNSNLIYYIMPFAAGNFFYISASDLVPELHKEVNLKKSFFSFFIFLSGIFILYFLKILIGDIA